MRAVQEKEFDCVGGTTTIKVDVRILAATNRKLKQSVMEGGFREDLFFRLNVINIVIPPLRERREDIVPEDIEIATAKAVFLFILWE